VQDGRKINSLDFHRTEDRLVTASDDETIRLYDTANAKYVFLLMRMRNRHHQDGLMICDENLWPRNFHILM
jgi:WD40 repeat protein